MRTTLYPTDKISLGGAQLGDSHDIELSVTIELSDTYYAKDRREVVALNLFTHRQREVPPLLTVCLTKKGIDELLDELLADPDWRQIVWDAVERGKEADKLAEIESAEDYVQMKRECRP